jgi:hypothetical protein
MRQAGYIKERRALPEAEEAKAIIAQRKEQCDREGAERLCGKPGTLKNAECCRRY